MITLKRKTNPPKIAAVRIKKAFKQNYSYHNYKQELSWSYFSVSSLYLSI